MNPTLVQLQDRLLRLHRKLRDQLDETDDAAAREALLREMVEVTHRIQLVGGLLFVEQAEALDAAAAKVAKAVKATNAAIQQVADLTAFLAAMTAFLALVDETIDLAKSLAV